MKWASSLKVWDDSVRHKGGDGNTYTKYTGKGKIVIHKTEPKLAPGDCETTYSRWLGLCIFSTIVFITAEALI